MTLLGQPQDVRQPKTGRGLLLAVALMTR